MHVENPCEIEPINAVIDQMNIWQLQLGWLRECQETSHRELLNIPRVKEIIYKFKPYTISLCVFIENVFDIDIILNNFYMISAIKMQFAPSTKCDKVTTAINFHISKTIVKLVTAPVPTRVHEILQCDIWSDT